MHIEMIARNELGFELFGTFSIPRVSAEAILTRRIAEHGISHDSKLLYWMKALPEAGSHLVPERSPQEDRFCYVVAELIAKQGNIIITCSKCNLPVRPSDIIVAEKDFSGEVSEMRMGFAGDLYQCPNQHNLLFVLTKIY